MNLKNFKLDKGHAFALLYLALILFFIFIINIGLFSNINNILTDNLYGGKDTFQNIIIVTIDDESISQIGRWPWNRSVYSTALKNIKNEKIIGIDITFFEESSDDDTFANELKNHNVVLASEFSSFEFDDNSIKGDKLQKPIFDSKTGYVNIITDKDGITRKVNLNLSGEYNHFSYEIYSSLYPVERIKEKSYYINFPNEPHSYNAIKFKDVLENNFEPDTFNNKIVLIGATSEDLHDNFFVPTSNGVAMPGVEVHASIIQTLINNNDLKHQSKQSIILYVIITTLLVAILSYYVKPIINAIIFFATIVIYELIAIFMFEYEIIMNIVFIPLTITISYLTFNIASYVIESNTKKKIQYAFGKYISPVIVDQLIDDQSRLKLGGDQKVVTTFFSDIRSFTSISEKLSPKELVKLLNEYFTSMSDIIIEYGGVVDKYIGDAIMAFWGAPIDDEHQANNAVKAAIKMNEELPKISQKFLKDKKIKFDIGMGINTGSVIVGNMGCDKRFDYTVIGDNVNLASRLEGLTKKYRVKIIISKHTKQKISKKFITRELDLVSVKGKSEPVEIFEVIGYKGEVSRKKIECIENYEAGLRLYRNSRFGEAIEKWEKSLECGHDKASETMIHRARNMIKHPVEDFNGVYVAKSK